MIRDKFINGSEPKIIMFFFLGGGGGGRGGGGGGGGGKGGEVGVEEEDSSIPMAQRHLADDICVPSRDGEYQ